MLDLEIGRIFSAIDANEDGRASWEEIQKALYPQDSIRVTPHRRNRQVNVSVALAPVRTPDPEESSESIFASSAKDNAALDRLRAKAAIAGLRQPEERLPPTHVAVRSPSRSILPRTSGPIVEVDVDDDRVQNLQNQIYFLELECALLRKQCVTEEGNEDTTTSAPTTSNSMSKKSHIQRNDGDIDVQLAELRVLAKRREEEQRRHIRKLESRIQHLEAEIGAADERARRFEATSIEEQKLRREAANEAEAQHVSDLREVATLKQRLQDLESDLERHRSERDAALAREKKERTCCREQIVELKSHSRKLEAELEAAQVRESATSDALAKAQRELADASVGAESAREAAENARKEASALASEIDGAREALARTTLKLRQAEVSKEQADEACERATKSLISQERALAASKTAASDALERCASLDRKLAEARTAARALKSDRKVAEAAASRCKGALESRLRQMESLESSGLEGEERFQIQSEQLLKAERATETWRESSKDLEKRQAQLIAESTALRDTVVRLTAEAKRDKAMLEASRRREDGLKAERQILQDTVLRLRAFTKLHDSQRELAALSQSTFSAAESMRQLLQVIAAPETKERISDMELEEEDGSLDVTETDGQKRSSGVHDEGEGGRGGSGESSSK